VLKSCRYRDKTTDDSGEVSLVIFRRESMHLALQQFIGMLVDPTILIERQPYWDYRLKEGLGPGTFY
jgi:hypothetical protein